MNDEKRAMIEEWIELHPVLLDRLETLTYVSGSNRNDDYSIKQSILEKELQIYGVKTCFTPEEFMQVYYNNSLHFNNEPIKKESKMKGPKKKNLWFFPIECLYYKYIVSQDDTHNILNNKYNKLREELNRIKENKGRKQWNKAFVFNSLSEIRTFLRDKAKENSCKKLLMKTGTFFNYAGCIALGYYSDDEGRYVENGKFITYHLLVPVRHNGFGPFIYFIDEELECIAGKEDWFGAVYILNNIWNL